MSSLTSKRSKRQLSDDDSDHQLDEENMTQNSKPFNPFIVIESLEEKPMSKVSPFIIEKQINSILGTPKSVKKLKNGNLLVECYNKTQAENLLKHKTFFNIKVKIYPHPTLNSCKGVIRCPELALCKDTEEIKANLKTRGVTDVYRIKTKRNGSLVPTNSYILTFNSPVLPNNLIINYQQYSIQPYIPNPLRCFQCQKFGHHIKNCRADPVCSKCAEKGHTFDECQNEAKCVNCGKNHPSFSKVCEIWKKEKQIQKLKVEKNITFEQARKEVENLTPSNKPSYAEVVKPNPDRCPTCTIIVEELSKHFPDVAEAINKKLKLTKHTATATPDKPSSSQNHEPPKPAQTNVTTNPGQIDTPPKQDTKEKQKPEDKKAKQAPSAPVDKSKQNKNHSDTTDKKKDGKNRLNRYEINEKSTEIVTAAIPVSKNKFSELQDMDSEMADADADESQTGWKSLPSWEDDPIPWDDSKPG